MKLGRAILLLTCLGWGVLPAAAGDDRLGWHGEEMPEGLERGAKEGEYVWKRDHSVMVYVPPGEFPMGSDEGDPDEKPVHTVWLDGYYIDKYEVSWEQWRLSGLPFSDNPASRRNMPRAPDWGILDEDPVLNVSWQDAQKYVGWAGKRLPTEAEWEKAARGTDGRTYPWGDEEPDFDRAIWKPHPIAAEKTAPVVSFEAGASPYGAVHMAGNAYEWCQDVYQADYYRRSPERNPVNGGPGQYRVLRGGAFVLELEDLRSALRYRLLPIDRAPYIGFRAAVSQSPKKSE